MGAEELFWASKAAEVEAELMARLPENKLRPRLDPTRMAVELLGDPQRSYRVVHVTGTNGKTSTVRFIERILREYGLRTGRFTSPHLVKLNERMAIDGEPVDDRVLYEVWQDIKPIIEIVDATLEAQGESKLTYFETLAVLGFAVFADAPVEVLVLEVGMGGEWDSTNVADGDVAVFTPIGLDHTDRLGNTIEEIAATKAGIIKPGSIVVSAKQPAAALEILKARAAEVADAWAGLGEQFEVLDATGEAFGQRFSVRGTAGQYDHLFFPLLGEHQLENIAVAIAAVEAFMGGTSKPIEQDVLRAALVDVSSPGRLQVISRDPLVILDAAHNPHGARSLSKALVDSFGAPYTIAVVAVLSDKDAEGIFNELDETIQAVVVTQSSSERAIPAAELGSLASKVLGAERVTVVADPIAALDQAIADLPKDFPAAVVVTGSISLVGEILKHQQLNIDFEEAEDEDDNE